MNVAATESLTMASTRSIVHRTHEFDKRFFLRMFSKQTYWLATHELLESILKGLSGRATLGLDSSFLESDSGEHWVQILYLLEFIPRGIRI